LTADRAPELKASFDSPRFVSVHMSMSHKAYAFDWDRFENELLPILEQFADFALTKYYDPSRDFGVHEHWIRLDDELPKPARNALLGFPVGPAGSLFDPGALGAYFQTPSMIAASLAALESHRHPELKIYLGLLRTITQSRGGLYVTF
jgi:hypothetical protein